MAQRTVRQSRGPQQHDEVYSTKEPLLGLALLTIGWLLHDVPYGLYFLIPSAYAWFFMSRQNTWWIAILVMSALLVLLRIYLGLDYMTTEVENFPVRSKQF